MSWRSAGAVHARYKAKCAELRETERERRRLAAYAADLERVIEEQRYIVSLAEQALGLTAAPPSAAAP